ncbi:MAG: hypothetical protein V7L13_11860 [Nostoc sp.]
MKLAIPELSLIVLIGACGSVSGIAFRLQAKNHTGISITNSVP